MARDPKRTKKKVSKNIAAGVAHVNSSFNNTKILISDVQGNAIAWSSAGTMGFKGSRKSTPYAAQMAAEDAGKKAQDHGVKTINSLGFLVSDASAGFTLVTEHLLALMYYLSFDYQLAEIDDLRFVPGRGASVIVEGTTVGELGEIHPQIVENWGLQVPCVACEIDLDVLHSIR